MFYILLIVLLSIVLESLPISSSGNIALLLTYLKKYHHVIFAHQLMGDLNYVVNFPIAVVLALFFFKEWRVLLKTMPRSLPIFFKMIVLGFVIELITVLFFVLFSFVTMPSIMLSVGFIITSCWLYSLRFIKLKETNVLNLHKAVLLGIVQGIALLPGISRFGSTYSVARWMGLRSQRAFELSFLISFPINCAAGLLGLFRLYQHNGLDLLSLPLLLIMLIGMLGAYCGLWLMSYLINAEKAWLFAWYTLLLAFVFLLL